MPDEPGAQVEVLDESDGRAYLFLGVDCADVDRLIARWSDGGEPTWTRRRPARSENGFTLNQATTRPM